MNKGNIFHADKDIWILTDNEDGITLECEDKKITIDIYTEEICKHAEGHQNFTFAEIQMIQDILMMAGIKNA